jgi:phage N-6-adenine-methyltransferase
MAKSNCVFSKDNEYYTPKYVVDMFGKFDYDPATTKEKAEEFNIPNFDTIKTDGLKSDWTQYKRIWINPPFTIKDKFIKKAVDTYKIAKNEIFILFPIEFLTTQTFFDMFYENVGAKIYIPNYRIKFESGLNKVGSTPAFGCIVIHLQDHNEVQFLKIKENNISHKQLTLF